MSDRDDWSPALLAVAEHLPVEEFSAADKLAIGWVVRDLEPRVVWIAQHGQRSTVGAALDAAVGGALAAALPASLGPFAAVIRAALYAGAAALYRSLQPSAVLVQSDADLEVEVDHGR